MQRLQAASVGWRLRVTDTVVIIGSFLMTLAFREYLPLFWSFDIVPGPKLLQDVGVRNQLHLLPLALPIWMWTLQSTATYQDLRRIRSDVLLLRIIRASLTALGLIIVADFLLRFDQPPSRTLLVGFSALVTVALWGARRLLLRLRLLNPEPMDVLAIGSPEEAGPYLELLTRHQDWGLRMIGVLSPESSAEHSQMSGVPVLGRINDLSRILTERNIGQVFVTGQTWETATLRFVAETCEQVGVTFTMDANFLQLGIAQAELQEVEGWSILTFTSTPLDSEALAIKRGLDVLGAAAALLLLSPVFLVVMLLIKLEDGGPVFYSQQRAGLYGRPFFMHKFRSMVVNADRLKDTLQAQNEAGGPVFKMKHDPRVTRVGRWIRKTSIDEFPQFWNVLVGEMSLVGPRPPIPAEVRRYERWQMRRLSMKPGITCIWQVSGRSDISFEQWMKLDLEYIDRWSLFLDLKLLVLTLPAVLTMRGAR